MSRAAPRPLRLALAGFGNVGRTFAELLPGPYGRALRAEGAAPVVTAIFTNRHGAAIDPRGLPLRRALRLVRAGGSLDALHRGPPVASALDLVRRAPADVLVELTPLAPTTGEPAISLARAALGRGLHVVTANKGPVAHARARLARLAARNGVRFLHEGAVLDGTPVFNLVERCLPGARILGFRGLLNSTTTRVLAGMEAGASFEAALADAQRAGVAEADPRHDLEGWDAAVKACALANALMGADVRPAAVERRGITGLGPEDVRAARGRGAVLRLVARARRDGRAVRVSVGPEEVADGDVLVSRGADGVLVLETDLMREIGIWEGAGGVDQTAYAILSDLVAIARGRRRR
ncbi:Homoserine dehydrogenase [Anaeromyxobacter dehalogenans 2CP-1]|uniref:Homoserine dehydrogenase n=1 Tax=Anaeromyxobacter dehalogenans (strain ATCC BAA-258 / DSM 21875 / 2CP-1) TaxID=455488 RepID=B8J9K2_ANAD2|nr:homoserine dehydrogenase [Anaeromyxobacter dehalogenans]ACL67390.1 Homoserine dehydrogenase [Anaeromyxobacter dehalogenans 2CP-1]